MHNFSLGKSKEIEAVYENINKANNAKHEDIKKVVEVTIDYHKSKGKKRELLDAIISAKSKHPR